MTPRFPAGFEVRIRDDVRRIDGQLLLGGSPLRMVRLSPTAVRLAQDGRVRVSDPVTETLAARLLDSNVADPVLEGEGVDPGLLTVVVPVRDRPEQLSRTLAHLRPLHCIVVDDASRDRGTIAHVAAEHGAELVPLTVNVGPGAARNAGLRRVRTPYVAFVDSDVLVDAATLRRLARHFADDHVALVGPLVRSRARSSQPRWFERFDEQVSSLALGTRACSVHPGAAVAWLPSACLVGRTDRLGTGFSEDLRVGEDVDLIWRLVARSEVVRYDPSEVAHHDTRTTMSGWLGRKFYYGTGGAPLAVRHGRTGAPAVMSPTMAVAAAAVLVRYRWSLPLAAAGVALGARSLDRRLPSSSQRRALAARLAVQGLWWAVRQESALLLRHWWPAAALLALRSRSVRRALISALLVDVVAARIDHPGVQYAPLCRRLDDLAYGAGLWAGAMRARSLLCLAPRRPGDLRTTGGRSTGRPVRPGRTPLSC